MEREGMKPCGRESPFSTSRPSCYWSRLCLECPPAQPLLESALTWEGSLPPVWSRARCVSQRILHPSLSSGSGCRGPAWQTAPLPEEEGQGQVHETVSSTSALGGLWLGFSSGPLSHVRCSTGRQAPGGLRSCLEGSRLRTTKNTGRSGSSGSYGLPCWLRWQRICLQCRKSRFYPWVRKIPWRRRWPPTPIFLPANMVFTTMWNNFHLGLFLRFWPHSSIMYRNLFKGLSLTWGRSVVAIRILKPPLQQD